MVAFSRDLSAGTRAAVAYEPLDISWEARPVVVTGQGFVDLCPPGVASAEGVMAFLNQA